MDHYVTALVRIGRLETADCWGLVFYYYCCVDEFVYTTCTSALAASVAGVAVHEDLRRGKAAMYFISNLHCRPAPIVDPAVNWRPERLVKGMTSDLQRQHVMGCYNTALTQRCTARTGEPQMDVKGSSKLHTATLGDLAKLRLKSETQDTMTYPR